jgi:hypothetical protein
MTLALCAALALLWAGMVLPLAGCNRYLVGRDTLYPPNIRTVYVPVFDSNSYRTGLGERLTEAVIKQIEVKTPYKVVDSPMADSILTVRILTDVKGTLVTAPTALSRELQNNMRVEVGWLDRQGALISQAQALPIPTTVVQVDQTANMTPEVGQSMATTQQRAIDQLAEQIVSLMEAPW